MTRPITAYLLPDGHVVWIDETAAKGAAVVNYELADGTFVRARRAGDDATRWYLQVSEEQAIDLASGYVPRAVVAQARFLLDCADADQRIAAARLDADDERQRRGRRR